MMWVYRETTQGEWEVGYYHPVHQGFGKWEGFTRYDEERDAMRAVHYLNGGAGAPVPW